MDEPFAALDAQTRDLLHDELERIWTQTGCTIIFVTHNVREAARLGRSGGAADVPAGPHQAGIQGEPASAPPDGTSAIYARGAKEMLDYLREEINKSLEAEYGSMKKLADKLFFIAHLHRGSGPCWRDSTSGRLTCFLHPGEYRNPCGRDLPIIVSGSESRSG